jgi:hypothetical protein
MTQHLLTNIVALHSLSKLTCISLVVAWCSTWTTATAADNRQVYNGETYRWLSAIGKLEVPGKRHRDGRTRHYIEDCSATLVGNPDSQSANTIITAWHCLEFYSDLSKPISFTLNPAHEKPILREAYQLVNGGSMDADWAILRLHRAIPAGQVKALNVDTARANPQRAIIMAGYSRDDGVGAGGQHLSFDPACLITRQDPTSSATNCTAYKGASGGAAIQLSSAGTPLVYGVISQGNGAGLSTFIPAHGFSSAIRQHLK